MVPSPKKRELLAYGSLFLVSGLSGCIGSITDDEKTKPSTTTQAPQNSEDPSSITERPGAQNLLIRNRNSVSHWITLTLHEDSTETSPIVDGEYEVKSGYGLKFSDILKHGKQYKLSIGLKGREEETWSFTAEGTCDGGATQLTGTPTTREQVHRPAVVEIEPDRIVHFVLACDTTLTGGIIYRTPKTTSSRENELSTTD